MAKKHPECPLSKIDAEIKDTQSKPQHETVGMHVRIVRSLYLHALVSTRDRDFGSVSRYIEALIRRDKHYPPVVVDTVTRPNHTPSQ